ncbi:unnamed protein product [Cuscuta europaea]|uniref:Uncharacterized protein n=1 Tax=Cuscuta europaea TaxID=41803 RepID=A0A9P0ZCI5_CUSEU|nr:unnamed protein product [Cuscuta europaea]
MALNSSGSTGDKPPSSRRGLLLSRRTAFQLARFVPLVKITIIRGGNGTLGGGGGGGLSCRFRFVYDFA